MTRTNRKLVAFIIGVTFLLATLGALAWATSGFENWNAAEWFNGWGQGISAPVEVEDTAARVRTSSTDVDHEIITDSEDSSTTFAVSKLSAPSLSTNALNDIKYLTVSLDDSIIGTVIVTMRIADYSSSSSVLCSLTSSDFTLAGEKYVAYIPIDTVRNAFKEYNVSAECGDFGKSLVFSAKNTGVDGYADSDSGSAIYMYNINELSSEFTSTTYRVRCPQEFYENSFYNFCIYSTDRRTTVLNLKNSNYVTYSDGYLNVDLLSMSNAITKQLDAYMIYFGLSSVNIGSNKISFYSASSVVLYYFSITRLSAPTNLMYNAGTLTWDSVDGATKYGVFWAEKGSEKKAFVDTPSYTFDLNALGEGEHTVRVRALGNLGQTAMSEGRTAMISAYNASSVVTQVVALTYNVDGDVVTKFVPYGSNVKDYLYTVELDDREFGGWYYDSGFSSKVQDTDVISGDMTIYARLSDKAVEERPVSWWGLNKWKVLIPCFVFGGLLLIGGIAAAIVKKKKAA